MKNLKFSLLLILPVLIIVLVRCSGEEDPVEQEQPVVNVPPVKISNPANDAQYIIGDPVMVDVAVNNASEVSNLALYVADTLYAGNLTAESQTIEIKTDENSKVGWTKFYLSYTDANGKARKDNRDVIFFSDVVPKQKVATIINEYKHAKTSYTQGLEFYKGKLFEGTGQYNQSILAEVNVETGEKIREIPLDGSVFGEGITILNDTIYQITYRSEICYMYDMDFNLIGEFSYEGEGWGLTNDGENIIMSNGSDQIVWRDPKTFEILHTIYVVDNQKTIAQLNELEIIDGNLYANLYTEARIAEIDMKTGKVLAYIDCSALEQSAQAAGNDVLNGIAHNPVTGKTYMTGKWWPKLFEVIFE